MRIRRRSALIFALVAGSARRGGSSDGHHVELHLQFQPHQGAEEELQGGIAHNQSGHELHQTGEQRTRRCRRADADLPGQELEDQSEGREQVCVEQLSSQTMAGAMDACKKAKVGTASRPRANGAFTIRGCVLLFNGKPKGGKPTLQIFTRVQASNPSTISCATREQHPGQRDDPADRRPEAGAVAIRQGPRRQPHHSVGDVPPRDLQDDDQKGNYISARCKASNKTWNMKVAGPTTTRRSGR